jgi:hypothetical protein
MAGKVVVTLSHRALRCDTATTTVEGGAWRNKARRGRKNQMYSSCLEHAFIIWSPVRELPYGPAAPSLHQRPDRWQLRLRANLLQKTACCTWRGATDESMS